MERVEPVLICPDCTVDLGSADTLSCDACGWRGEIREGIPIYLSRADREDPIMKEYIGNYDKICVDDLNESLIDDQFLRNIAGKTSLFVRDVEGATVCDIGSGKGYLAKSLLDRGASSVTTVDISLDYLLRLKDCHRLRPVLCNAENLPFRNEFDIMVTTDVMEHVLNLGSFLYAMNRALRIGGRVYVRVPYDEDLLSYSPHLGCSYRFVHLRSFNAKLLRMYLKNSGFVVEKIRHENFWLGIPREFWARYPSARSFYDWFKDQATKRLAHPTDITTWDSRIAGIFMQPQELFVTARKIKEIDRHPGGGALLRTDGSRDVGRHPAEANGG